jgi:hypothetical protein
VTGSPSHLVKRFVTSLVPGGPPFEAEAWVASVLSEGEVGLWRRMSGPDRRHAVGVARRVEAALGVGRATPPVLAAALLHDIGKVESGLGTLARVAATLSPVRTSRMETYRNHAELGGRLLEAAGADPLTVAWAREHHLPLARWTVPAELGSVLKAADD